jgi:hypothetical protein
VSKENYEKTKGADYWPIVAMEEAAEVIQGISKIVRFGASEARQEDLQNEIQDLLYCLQMMEYYGALRLPSYEDAITRAETKRGRNFTSVLRDEIDD